MLDNFAERIGGDHFGLPRVPIRLWGEVIACHEGRERYFLTLLDAECDDKAVHASLPARARKPKLGEMIGVEGSLHVELDQEGGAALSVRGSENFESRGPSKRASRWRAEFERCRTRYAKPRHIEGPIHTIALVTSESSHAVHDFHRAFRGHGDPLAKVNVVPVDLGDPLKIAVGVIKARSQADLIVVTRGGGSALQLHTFCHPEVVEAIALTSQSVPVLVAIGHDRDRPAAEQFASYVSSTPNGAGEKARRLCWITARAQPARNASVPAPPRPAATPAASSVVATSAPTPRPHVTVAAPQPAYALPASGQRAKLASRRRRLLLAVLGLALLVGGGAGWFLRERAAASVGEERRSSEVLRRSPEPAPVVVPDAGQDRSKERRRRREPTVGREKPCMLQCPSPMTKITPCAPPRCQEKPKAPPPKGQ